MRDEDNPDGTRGLVGAGGGVRMANETEEVERREQLICDVLQSGLSPREGS